MIYYRVAKPFFNVTERILCLSETRVIFSETHVVFIVPKGGSNRFHIQPLGGNRGAQESLCKSMVKNPGLKDE